MSESVVQPPTKEILGLCDHSDLLIERYLACLNAKPPNWGRFEAEVETYTILKLLLRHLESVCQLARHDLVLLPSAVVIARAAFEAQVRARWLLKPVDPYEREVRWVLHLRSASDHCEKLETNKHIPEQVAEIYRQRRSSYETFDADISRLLVERGYNIPKQAPNIWEMLKDIGKPELYQIYILLSAYTHTNFEAGSLYRKNLGGGKELGEFITAKDWWLPLSVAWRSFYVVACDFLYWVEADSKTFGAEDLSQAFESRLKQLHSASTR
jgi:hypothetical protein